MAQVTSGFRAILSSPKVYDVFQDLMGAQSIRAGLVRDRVRPFPGCRILDIGCGTARILDYLPDVEYWGFDPSQRYIEEATRRYRKRGNFRCAIVEQAVVDDLGPFDVVIAIGVLHHLDDQQASTLTKLAWSALQPRGRLITIDPCFAKDQNSIARLLISRDRGQNVRYGEQYCRLATGEFLHVSGEVRHRGWVPYTHWIMECQK